MSDDGRSTSEGAPRDSVVQDLDTRITPQGNGDSNRDGSGAGDAPMGRGGISDGDDIEGKIFVGGLSWATTEEGLRFYFEKFGEVADVSLMIDKRTGQPR